MVREATGETTDTGNVASGDTVHQRLHCSEGDRTRETTLQSIIHTKSFSSVYLEGRKPFCSITLSTSTTNYSSPVALSFHGDKVSLDTHDAHMHYKHISHSYWATVLQLTRSSATDTCGFF